MNPERRGRACALLLVAALASAGCAGGGRLRPDPVNVPPPPSTLEPADEKVSLSGTIVWRQSVALAPGAVVKVWLQDVSRANLPVPEILDEQIIERPGPQPLRFRVRYDPREIDSSHTYTLLVRIYEGDRIRFINAQRFPVITGGCTADCEVLVDMMN